MNSALPPVMTAAEAAPLLHCSPQALRIAMRDHPEWLPPGTVVRTSATRCRMIRTALYQALGLTETGSVENNIAAGVTSTNGDNSAQ